MSDTILNSIAAALGEQRAQITALTAVCGVLAAALAQSTGGAASLDAFLESAVNMLPNDGAQEGERIINAVRSAMQSQSGAY